jgi:hypothetical protein
MHMKLYNVCLTPLGPLSTSTARDESTFQIISHLNLPISPWQETEVDLSTFLVQV